MKHFSGKLAVIQRVLPSYRAPFFDLLASACDDGMSLFTGLPRPQEGITTTDQLQVANYKLGRNIHLFDGISYLCFQRGLINWLEEQNPKVLIVEANPRYLSTPNAVKWMHKRNRPVIGWGLGSPPISGFRRKRRFSFINQFDAMISYSKHGAAEYAGLGFPRERIYVAHNSVSPAPSHPLPFRSSTFTHQPNILFVGRLQSRKQVDYLLHACAEIQNLKLVVVGDGPQRESLELLAQKVYPGTEFIGAKHGDELKAYFEKADLFVLPGTGGLAVQEAMSFGLPIIVAQGDGTQDDLVRRENGWQIPPDDFDALVSTMKDALSNTARLRRMGAESYRIVKEEINIEKMVDVFMNAVNVVNSLTAK
jgi:glycosyltransferase involved in cell wall biosynthesis